MDLGTRLDAGHNPDHARSELRRSIALKLAAMGHVMEGDDLEDRAIRELTRDVFARYREQARLLRGYQCPADRRIQSFVDDLFSDLPLNGSIRLPTSTLTLDRHGLARELSLPADQDCFQNDIIASYRLDNGVLHNPANDRRTTQGVFHVADIGLPVPFDKIPVAPLVFGNLLHAALHPPDELMLLPFSTNWENRIHLWVSLLLRPLVCPGVSGILPEKSTEVRFISPASLMANLDFVESIFGNAGDPFLPENDSALDIDHWTGHTGCVILAPHLVRVTKKDLGLPQRSEASERERSFGMCWEQPDELYNDGRPFKVACRDARGVMVTVITDNYFGYCKKEVKTQISFSANLWGLAEEEHAGGALAFATYRLGDELIPGKFMRSTGHSFNDVIATLCETIDVKGEGYAIDRKFSEVLYVPEDTRIELGSQRVWWTRDGKEQEIKLLPGRVYVHPSGYRVRLEKHVLAPSWHLIGTAADGVLCHKPCTVSGGGKSEISKSMINSMLSGPIYVGDFEADMEAVKKIIERDYSNRLKPHLRPDYSQRRSRSVLNADRSLGSVIKMLTPSESGYTDEYNAWLATIPNHILALVFIIKRFYRRSWGDDWQSRFGVDLINGERGHELKYGNRELVGSYVRVGFHRDGSWRTFKLRQDFMCADKVQMEDDISASVTVPSRWLDLPGNDSVKLVENCEYRLFQRPDEAFQPGYDTQTELDMSSPGLFASNYEPLSPESTRKMVEDVFLLDAFTAPMAEKLEAAAKRDGGYTVCSARPRMVDGKPSKNPRYLQLRPDAAEPRERYLAEISTRLYRRLEASQPVPFPVSSVLSGRRNNPPHEGIRPLCVYNPLHFQELPELFMDYICSLTGKSPSTTGAGSEGAMTKGPFNALRATSDLNNALVSMILCGYGGFSTSAGWLGPHYRVDHDISLLIPEIWCRLSAQERNAAWLVEHSYLDKVDDFEFQGRRVLASRLGYRMNAKFARVFLGRMFDVPNIVLTDEMLAPETQDLGVFADGVDNIVEAQKRVAQAYLDDGSVEHACPPLGALLHIMATGKWDGKDVHNPSVRQMFTREALFAGDWYRQRLATRQKRDIALWERHTSSLEAVITDPSYEPEVERLGLAERLGRARAELERVRAPSYLEDLHGTIGADPC